MQKQPTPPLIASLTCQILSQEVITQAKTPEDFDSEAFKQSMAQIAIRLETLADARNAQKSNNQGGMKL